MKNNNIYAFAYDDLLTLPNDLGAGRNVRGEVILANADRFLEGHFSQPLTTFATGAMDNDAVAQLLDAICGAAIPTARRFEYAEFTRLEEFEADTDDLRAIGGDFKRVRYTSDKVNGRTDPRGLTYRVDKDEIDELGAQWQENVVAKLQRRLLRNALRRAITLLAAAANNTAKTWDTTAGKDPDMDVLTELVTAADLSGVRPNTILYGDTSWNKRALSHRAQNNAGGYASALLQPDGVAGILGVDKVVRTGARYRSGASALTQIVGNLVLMYIASDGQDIDDPSNIKRFVSDGGGFKVYVQEFPTGWDLTVSYKDLIAILTTLGMRKFTIS